MPRTGAQSTLHGVVFEILGLGLERHYSSSTTLPLPSIPHLTELVLMDREHHRLSKEDFTLLGPALLQRMPKLKPAMFLHNSRRHLAQMIRLW